MQKIQLSRRQALAGLGAGMVACRPQTQAPIETAGKIDTIVVVMMENRSFDHVYGAMALAGAAVDGLLMHTSNPAPDGSTVPIQESTLDCDTDPPHGWNSSHDQFNGGYNDGFVRAFLASHPDADPAEVMSYQTRTRMPVSWALAEAYSHPQRWFASVMGPTWPNRFYGHSGSSAGLQSNELPNGQLYDLPTVWRKLDEIGIPWGYYYSDLPFLALFNGHVRPETTMYLEDFYRDAAAGNLPPVVWIDPGFSFNDDHPPHPVGRGQEFLASIYKALAESPHWENCLLVITYDEHGGFYDHVPPPLTDDDDVADGFDQLGFRVPAVVVGPYVKTGPSDVVFDNTSWIKYICEVYGITPWTRRIAAANSIGLLLDTERLAQNAPQAPISLPEFLMDETGLGEECSGDGVFGPVPPEHQEELALFIETHYPELDRRAEKDKILALIRAQLKA